MNAEALVEYIKLHLLEPHPERIVGADHLEKLRY